MPGSFDALPLLFAQAAAARRGPPSRGEPGPALLAFVPYVVIIGLWFYLLLIRPQQKQEKQRKAMIEGSRRTTGPHAAGIYGTVISVDARRGPRRRPDRRRQGGQGRLHEGEHRPGDRRARTRKGEDEGRGTPHAGRTADGVGKRGPRLGARGRGRPSTVTRTSQRHDHRHDPDSSADAGRARWL